MITDYGSLKTTVQQYLGNRSEQTLVDNIPSFIQMAHKRLFRRLRVRENETEYTWPDLAEGEAYAALTLPNDFLELKFLLSDGEPLTRISDLRMQQLLFSASGVGEPQGYARIGNELKLWPPPDAYRVASMVYWSDPGDFVEDTDTNAVLATAPDLYLYGALTQAAPYLIDDERVPVWQALYNEGLALIEADRDEAEYAGSVVSVSGVGADL